MTVAQGEITLNGFRYAVTQPIIRQPLDSFIPAQSTSGRKQRGDRLLLDSSEIRELTGGFGISRYRDSNDWNRFWDSTAETRFPGQITPSILEADTTDDCTTDATRAVEFNGVVHYAQAGGGQSVQDVTFAGSTQRWAASTAKDFGGGNVTYTHDIMVANGKLYIMFPNAIPAVNGEDAAYYDTSWHDGNMTGADVAFVDGGKMWSSEGTLLAALWDSSAKSIKIYKSTNDFGTVTLVATITSSSSPNSWATYYDRSGVERPLLSTAEGVYYIDITNSTAVMLFAMSAHPNNGLGMVVWESRLYVPIGGTGGAKMHRITYTGSTWMVESIGPGADDGIPADRRADISCLYPVEGGWLFAGTTATTNVYPSIWAIDPNGTYHHMWKGASTNTVVRFVAVSGNDDTTIRLHFTDGLNLKFLKYPLDNPYANSSIAFTDGSYIDTPEDDGQLPELSKCWLEAVALSSHSSSAEDIDITYGIDGAARTTTSLGSITSTDADIPFASGVGVSGKSIAFRLVLDRGATTTNKVSMKTFTTNYLNVPSVRYEYYVVVDPDATARSRGNSATPDSIRTELETVESSVTLLPFKYDRGGAVYVKCLPAGTQWMKGLERTGVSNQWQELSSKGMVVLHLVELL